MDTDNNSNAQISAKDAAEFLFERSEYDCHLMLNSYYIDLEAYLDMLDKETYGSSLGNARTLSKQLGDAIDKLKNIFLEKRDGKSNM